MPTSLVHFAMQPMGSPTPDLYQAVPRHLLIINCRFQNLWVASVARGTLVFEIPRNLTLERLLVIECRHEDLRRNECAMSIHYPDNAYSYSQIYHGAQSIYESSFSLLNCSILEVRLPI